MVRLEGQLINFMDAEGRVSIPIWCDWKAMRAAEVTVRFGFNSYMVRLEVGLGPLF